MADFQYHLYAPGPGGLAPEFEGALLGRDVLARNRATGQAVILKAFRRPWQSVLSEDHKDIWRQTRHPALVSFLRTEPSLAEGTLYAYHAYQFETLADAAPAIRDAVNYSPRIYVGHFAKAAEALHTLAQMGVHHGAINPESVVVTRVDGRVRIKDFGLQIRLAEDVDRSLGWLRGCFPYIAPEVFDALVQGEDVPQTVAADVYSFGAVLHDFFFAAPVLDSKDAEPRELIVKVLAGEIDLLDNWSELPLLTAIIHRCLHPDPSRRYQSFGSLAADLAYAADLRLQFVGEDAFGLRFTDARQGEVRVLSECLTLAAQPHGVTDQLGFYLPPDWRVDGGTRTVLRTDLAGLEPLGGMNLPLNVLEFHFLQAMSDLSRQDAAGAFVSHLALLWIDPAEARMFHLYPGLRPRAGQEAAFREWLETLASSGMCAILAPEVQQHAAALEQQMPVASFDEIDEESARRSALYAGGRLFYTLMTADMPEYEPQGALEPLASAFYKNPEVSVQMSELLAGCVEPDPGSRTDSAASVVADYQARSARLRKPEPAEQS
ncbi:MAG: protein kinase [Planctomycetota bacterium]